MSYTSKAIYNFILENRLDWALVFIRTPYPGTRLWDIALADGQVKDKGENWDRFTVWASYSKYDPSYIAKGRKLWELKMLQKFANTIFPMIGASQKILSSTQRIHLSLLRELLRCDGSNGDH